MTIYTIICNCCNLSHITNSLSLLIVNKSACFKNTSLKSNFIKYDNKFRQLLKQSQTIRITANVNNTITDGGSTAPVNC